MPILNKIKLDFSDVLIEPQVSNLSSRSAVNPYNSDGFIPVMCANMTTVGTFRMCKAMHDHKFMSCLNKHEKIEDIVNYIEEDNTRIKSTFFSFGMKDVDLQNIRKLISLVGSNVKICLDVANGYQTEFHQFIRKVRTLSDSIQIMAGNVVTPVGARKLHDAGANIIKVGIGSGSACLTRKITGVGFPQLSAINECFEYDEYNEYYDNHISFCSDGGHVVPGDICKAFVAGAQFVMLGGMLAGHSECFQEDLDNNPEFVSFYGMSSDTANMKYAGGLKGYRTSEGRELRIPYKGSVINTLKEIEGGIRSCMTYTGSAMINQLRYANLIRVNSQLNRSLENYQI